MSERPAWIHAVNEIEPGKWYWTFDGADGLPHQILSWAAPCGAEHAQQKLVEAIAFHNALRGMEPEAVARVVENYNRLLVASTEIDAANERCCELQRTPTATEAEKKAADLRYAAAVKLWKQVLDETLRSDALAAKETAT